MEIRGFILNRESPQRESSERDKSPSQQLTGLLLPHRISEISSLFRVSTQTTQFAGMAHQLFLAEPRSRLGSVV